MGSPPLPQNSIIAIEMASLAQPDSLSGEGVGEGESRVKCYTLSSLVPRPYTDVTLM